MFLTFLIWRHTAKFLAALLGQKSLDFDDPNREKINDVSSSGNFMELGWTQRLVSLTKTVVILWGTYAWVKYTHRSPGLLTRTRTRLEEVSLVRAWVLPTTLSFAVWDFSVISHEDLCTLLLPSMMYGIVFTMCCSRYEMLCWAICWIN